MRILLPLAFAAIVGLSAPAMAQSFSGSTGTPTGSAGNGAAPVPQVSAQTPPSTVPPVFQGTAPQAPTAPTVPTTPTVASPATGAAAPKAENLPKDPCAAYMSSYDAYTVCQNRIKLYDRMKQAKEDRAAAAQALREKREADRKAAQAPAPAKTGFRLPGQVDPPPKAPLQVQVVPQTPEQGATQAK